MMKIKVQQYQEIDFDSVEASVMALETMKSKKCLRDIYVETYTEMFALRERLLVKGGKVLELGSGGGFIKDIFPETITSDIKPLPHVDIVINAEVLPFEDHSLDAIMLVHVLHHISDVTKFFDEAQRVLKPGGGIICVEPYWSPLAKWIYKNVHPEPFDEHATDWLVHGNTPTSSNQAMSYLLLVRDNKKFREMYPGLTLVYQKRFGFLRYMMTGGVWLKPKLPDWGFTVLKYVEKVLTPLMPLVALHHVFVWKYREK